MKLAGVELDDLYKCGNGGFLVANADGRAAEKNFLTVSGVLGVTTFALSIRGKVLLGKFMAASAALPDRNGIWGRVATSQMVVAGEVYVVQQGTSHKVLAYSHDTLSRFSSTQDSAGRKTTREASATTKIEGVKQELAQGYRLP